MAEEMCFLSRCIILCSRVTLGVRKLHNFLSMWHSSKVKRVFLSNYNAVISPTMTQKRKKNLLQVWMCASHGVWIWDLFLKNVHHEVVLVHMWSKDEPKSLLFLIIKDHLRQKIEFRHQQKQKLFFLATLRYDSNITVIVSWLMCKSKVNWHS